MSNKRQSRLFKFVAVSAVVGLVMSSAPAVYADENFSVGRSFIWSPYVDLATASVSGDLLSTELQYYFDQAGADAHNQAYYYTNEINNVPDGLAYYAQVTNLPYPHYDRDDDNGDGYEEELEAAESYKSILQSYVEYWHTAYWENTRSTSRAGGTINYIAQRSVINPANGEYEALHYDLLTQKTYGTIGANTFAAMAYKGGDETVINVNPEIHSLNDLESSKEEQKKNTAKLKADKTFKGKKVPVTVTFSQPVSVEKLQSYLMETGSDLNDYEVKWINGANEWITGSFADASQEKIDRVQQDLIDRGRAVFLNYEGVTSARVLIDAEETAMAKAADHELIFYADFSEALIRAEHEAKGKKVKVNVPDLAWAIQDLQ